MASLFSIPIDQLKGVGPRRAERFCRLGVPSVGALLRFYPRAYRDWSHPVAIADALPDADCVVCATVLRAPTEHRIRKGMTLYKCTIADDTGAAEVTLFNNPYGAQLLKAGELYYFRGRVAAFGSRRTLSAPDFVPAAEAGAIEPVYPQTEGLSSRIIAGAVRQALAMLGPVRDPLPESIRTARGLMALDDALRAIHFPADEAALRESRRRMAFEELLVLQLGLMQAKTNARAAAGLRLTCDRSDEYFALLPFAPTNAQRRAVHECVTDMTGASPMSRLLQGDVGSGKTAVAAALCYCAARESIQTALMAPTEILAAQHYHTLTALFAGAGVRCALLTGSVPAAQKKQICAQLAAGEIDVVVGTHALLSDPVQFARLGLVITDEQHRFGVAQRSALAAKGPFPHLLVMSATPIPRTLALILYGDLDVSILDELPPGRTPVQTMAISSAKRDRAFGFIRAQLDAGHQAYVVCSLVALDESDDAPPDDRKAAVDYCAELQSGALAGYAVGVLHGQMKPAEKDAVMADFAAGRTQVLVATTVIEVGVDVPNASVMMIENAERFGLSQLHQLRGRVGRGQTQSYCILVSDAKNDDARQRLRVMTETTDGFRIADADLRLRGPGDFFGTRQHGLPVLHTADLCDLDTMRDAQDDARALLAADPLLSAPALRPLRAEVRRLFDGVGSLN